MNSIRIPAVRVRRSALLPFSRAYSGNVLESENHTGHHSALSCLLFWNLDFSFAVISETPEQADSDFGAQLVLIRRHFVRMTLVRWHDDKTFCGTTYDGCDGMSK
jgi:hypothetical protein